MDGQDRSVAADPGPRPNEETPLLGEAIGNGANAPDAQEHGQSQDYEPKELSNRRLAAVFGSVWVCRPLLNLDHPPELTHENSQIVAVMTALGALNLFLMMITPVSVSPI